MRHHEFWHPRLFEAPYYAYLIVRALARGVWPKHLVKANYALDHGELGIGSKFTTQMAFPQHHFPETIRVDLPGEHSAARSFARTHGYPLILKPDIGYVGKGVMRIASDCELEATLPRLTGPYLAQTFCPATEEFGVFYVRAGGRARITGINRKHFPEVIGNGRDSIATLAARHPRHTGHWSLFLRYLDLERVPAEGEVVRLSFIGSHTMGCKFTDDSELLTPELERAILNICDAQPGFNFGRFDVKTDGIESLARGEFTVIEVNGVASLPTHMFDPELSLRDSYRIFLEHARYLVEAAREHRERPMQIDPILDVWRRAKHNYARLNEMHRFATEEDYPSKAT